MSRDEAMCMGSASAPSTEDYFITICEPMAALRHTFFVPYFAGAIVTSVSSVAEYNERVYECNPRLGHYAIMFSFLFNQQTIASGRYSHAMNCRQCSVPIITTYYDTGIQNPLKIQILCPKDISSSILSILTSIIKLSTCKFRSNTI